MTLSKSVAYAGRLSKSNNQSDRTLFYVSMYLCAVVLANLSVTTFGPSVAILNAFLFIGLDLTARDTLHERWQDNHLAFRMTALIATGSVLSYLLNRDSGIIAIASFLAFAAAATTDTFVYQKLKKRPRWMKINGSNVPSAAVDSLIFPAVAWGFPLLWPIVLGQFVAKILGGFVWSLLLLAKIRQPES